MFVRTKGYPCENKALFICFFRFFFRKSKKAFRLVKIVKPRGTPGVFPIYWRISDILYGKRNKRLNQGYKFGQAFQIHSRNFL